MAKFAIITCEDKVFQGDKIQFDFTKSVITPDETAAAISHEFSIDGVTYINITPTKMIDWVFTVAGPQTVYFRHTSNLGSQVSMKTIAILDLALQKLFSTDTDLVAYEPEIIKWLPKKWSSWNFIHLRAQDYIINLLREKRILDKNGSAYTKDDIFDRSEVRDLSAALVLRYIFSGTSNASDDVFQKKSDEYDELVSERESTMCVKLDFNKNGIKDESSDSVTEAFHSIEMRRG